MKVGQPKSVCKKTFCPDMAPADDSAWKTCYREGARKHHPDRGGDEETMKKLNNCNVVMSEKESKDQTRKTPTTKVLQWIRRMFPLTHEQINPKTKKKLYRAHRITSDEMLEKLPPHFINVTTKRTSAEKTEVQLYFDPSNRTHRGLVRSALQILGKETATRENLPGDNFTESLKTFVDSSGQTEGRQYVLVSTTNELAQTFQNFEMENIDGVTKKLYRRRNIKWWHFWRLKHDDIKTKYKVARYLSEYLRKEDRKLAISEAQEKIEEAQKKLEKTFCKKNLDAYVDALRKDYALSYPVSKELIDSWVEAAKERQIPDKSQEFIYLKSTETGVDTQLREFLRNVWKTEKRPLTHITPTLSRTNPNYAVTESRRDIEMHSNDPTTRKARLEKFDGLVANKDKWFTQCLGFESLKTEVLEPLREIVRETVEEWTAADEQITADQTEAETKAKVAKAFQTRITTLKTSDKPPGPKVAKMYSAGLAWIQLPAAEQKQKAKRALGILRRLNTA